jgi:hypothetical protein
MTFPYVTRAQWGAAAPSAGLTHWPAGQPTGHTYHWEGAGGHTDHSQCALEVRMIQRYHQTHGYSDIAYNWIICIHGVIFEGRPAAQFESAAQRGGNPLRIAVCFMWGQSFSLSAAAAGTAIYHAGPAHAIGHMDEPTCSTGCPGAENEAFVHTLAGSAPVPAPPQPHPAPKPNPLPPGGVHHPTLRQGNVGPAVLELQRKLVGGFGQHISVDGVFGPMTRAAVTNAQRFLRIAQDGIAGPQTWGGVDFIAAWHGVR